MRRLALAALTIAVLTGLSAIDAVAAGSPVVPRGGTAAGEGYGYYLKRATQLVYASKKKPGLPACVTITVDGTKVTILSGEAHRFTCDVPAGRALYYDVLSSGCDTYPGDHDKYGTSDAALRRCAKASIKGATASGRVDGTPVDVNRLFATSGAFTVKLSDTDNIYGNKTFDGRSGRAAVVGYGLLLSGLSTGTHTVVGTGAVPADKYKSSQTITVHVS